MLMTVMQAFRPELMVTDILLFGGVALADKFGIPKAMILPGQFAPLINYMAGAGTHMLAKSHGKPTIFICFIGCIFLSKD